LDQLEQYELEFNDSERLEEDDWGSNMDDNVKDVIKQLSFPYGASEPEVSDGVTLLKKDESIIPQKKIVRYRK